MSKAKKAPIAQEKSKARFWVVGGMALALATTAALYAIQRSSGQEQTQSEEASRHKHASGPKPTNDGGPSGSVNLTPAPGAAPEGMVWIPGGTFWMGCDDCHMPDAAPVHLTTVDGYWMDATPVTNREFEKFVKATRYLTIAERKPDAKDFPGAPEENLVPGCAVFSPPPGEVPLNNPYAWWRYVPGANWKHPEGPGSSIQGREDHPAVHIAWEDAAAYAKWADKRLPTEAEFEFAARGGLDRKHFAWGDELKPKNAWAANIWQGKFPSSNTNEDGYLSTSPTKAFPANGFGLYDMGGNVWQWCSDWYRPDYYETLAGRGPTRNPKGPDDSLDPDEPGVPKRVQKSGSFLCSDQYCARYYVGSRGKGAVDSGSSNVGFRCVRSAS